MAAVIAGVAIVGSGCGSIDALCAPSGCAGVEGVVDACGGPAPGACTRQRLREVTLVDSRGREVQKEFPATGHLLDGRFSFSALVPGRYTVEITVDGQLWRRRVTVRTGMTVRANIVIPIR